MEWRDLHSEKIEEFTQFSFYSIKKHQQGKEVEFRITVKEFALAPPGQHLRFFAEADKQVNQGTAAFLPAGWGDSAANALADCVRLIRQFPYEGVE